MFILINLYLLDVFLKICFDIFSQMQVSLKKDVLHLKKKKIKIVLYLISTDIHN